MRDFALLALIATVASNAQVPTPPEIRLLAQQAYNFAYPMVLMEFTRRNASDQAPPNSFANAPAFPDASFRRVIRPNADTLYSSAWLDLSKEPMLLHVPDTAGRYYLMQMMDAWTETFAIPGKRLNGTGEGWFAIVGPGWTGTLPERAQRIDSPTNMVWLLGRTQTNGPDDYPVVHAIQHGYGLMPLSKYPDGAVPFRQRPQPAAATAMPPAQVAQLTAAQFFALFADLLQANPPHSGDEAMMRDLARIGIVPGKPFRAEALGPEGAKALEEGARAVQARLAAIDGQVGKPGPTGWTGGTGKVGRYGTDYVARAVVARVGLGANPPEDAVYLHCQQDSEGRPLDGSHAYRIHFEKSRMPPVKAFWSATMYSPDGYFVANPIHRFAIGDRDRLNFNPDGSLDLYIQHSAPGGEADSNWLPAPAGEFNLSLRLYWPAEEVLSGKWLPPAIVRQ